MPFLQQAPEVLRTKYRELAESCGVGNKPAALAFPLLCFLPPFCSGKDYWNLGQLDFLPGTLRCFLGTLLGVVLPKSLEQLISLRERVCCCVRVLRRGILRLRNHLFPNNLSAIEFT